MIHAKNYENIFELVKVVYRILWTFFHATYVYKWTIGMCISLSAQFV